MIMALPFVTGSPVDTDSHSGVRERLIATLLPKT